MTILGESEDRFHNLTSLGSYEWSYVDGLSDDGEWGFVAIWFCGIPMSPYYTAAIDRARRSPSNPFPDPLDYCAFNFNLYHRGRRVYYALHERPQELFTTDGRARDVRLADNALYFNDAPGGGSYALSIDTRLPRQRSRLVGEIKVTAKPQSLPSVAVALPERLWGHYWVPAALDGTFVADLAIRRLGGGTRRIEFAGRAYHDRNFGTVPLHDIPGDWMWGRLHLGPWIFVYFDIARDNPDERFGRILLLRDGVPVYDDDRVDVRGSEFAAHWTTLKYPRSLSGIGGSGLRFEGTTTALLDSGPFYHRYLSRLRVEIPDGRIIEGIGIGELLRPSRLRAALLRPFIKFRVRRR